MNIDWVLLRRQKEWLFKLTNEISSNPDAWTDNDFDCADGLLYLLDTIQDYAVDNGDATEFEVFGDLIGY